MDTDWFDRREGQWLSGDQVKRRTVEWALDDAVVDVEIAIGERGFGMTAGVIDSMKLAFHVEDRHRDAVDLDPSRVAWR